MPMIWCIEVLDPEAFFADDRRWQPWHWLCYSLDLQDVAHGMNYFWRVRSLKQIQKWWIIDLLFAWEPSVWIISTQNFIEVSVVLKKGFKHLVRFSQCCNSPLGHTLFPWKAKLCSCEWSGREDLLSERQARTILKCTQHWSSFTSLGWWCCHCVGESWGRCFHSSRQLWFLDDWNTRFPTDASERFLSSAQLWELIKCWIFAWHIGIFKIFQIFYLQFSSTKNNMRQYHHPRGQDLEGDFNVLLAALELAKALKRRLVLPRRGWVNCHPSNHPTCGENSISV